MSQVNVIDSIVITQEYDKTKVLAEWSALDSDITIYGELTSAQAVKLFLNWSDQNGTIPLKKGDYFTFAVPNVFRQDNITNVTDAAITAALGEVAATYSIYDNDEQRKEVKITFTDYVGTHANVSGDFWLLLFVGRVDSTEEKTLEFLVNGELKAEGNITVNPEPSYSRLPHDEKSGHSALGDIYNGYYIFNWTVYFNMDEDSVNGFPTRENFSFDDVIPADSPHVFLTDGIRQQLGLSPTQFPLRVGEYTQADSYSPSDRYPFFKYQYNGTGASLWFLDYAPLVDGYTTAGIDGAVGINVSDLVVTEKSISANLGRLTRPTGIQYCTMATVKIAESALGDSEVVKLFDNTYKLSYGGDLTSSLIIHRFESGGTAQGISGDYSFNFTKVSENGLMLFGAMFSLYISEDFSVGADRIAYSDINGIVSFRNLPEGIFYIQETIAPYGYIPNRTIYKVVLSRNGFEIYYGDNYEKKLSDNDNKVVNIKVAPPAATFTGAKKLTGRTLSSGMFSFVAKDKSGKVVSTGTNGVNGVISFSKIEFDESGVYTFTVEEVKGGYSGITYDDTIFSVTVMVSEDGNVEVIYPAGGIVFNNSYAEPVAVTLTGKKNLTGKNLSSGMFSFVVKNDSGMVVATGTNGANGDITFSKIELGSPGAYIFTVEEVKGILSGITYDGSVFTVTVTVKDDGNVDVTYPAGGIVFNNSYKAKTKPCNCYARSTKCRISIKGQKTWIDNGNAGGTRPDYVRITLLRDDKEYKSMDIDSTGDGTFIFCCVPIGKSPRHKYEYRIDELDVPDGYSKTVEGYNVINTRTRDMVLKQ